MTRRTLNDYPNGVACLRCFVEPAEELAVGTFITQATDDNDAKERRDAVFRGYAPPLPPPPSMPPRIAGTHLRRKGTPAEWQAATELTYCGGNLKSSKYEITQLDFDRTSLLPDTELILTNLGDQYERNAWRHATDAVSYTHLTLPTILLV